MRIFVTGATGYIGSSVALACRRAGHEVFGLVRSASKARKLTRHEVRVVVGSLQNPDSYLGVARECSVLIHTAFDPSDGVALDRSTVETLLKAGEAGARPKTLIYTSGVWANGDTKCLLVDETAPAAPIAAVAHRPGIEALVLGSSVVMGIVFRPGVVFGGRGGLTGLWFGGAVKDKAVKVIGDGKNHLPPVHVEDLADSYLRAAGSGLAGELFLLADASTATAKEMASAAARAAGVQGEVQLWPTADAAKAMGVWVEGLALDQHIDSGKARRRLGWEPKHRPFVDEAETYFEAWKDYQNG
jgi:nucleoside-diphosphate-sugar epimerase